MEIFEAIRGRRAVRAFTEAEVDRVIEVLPRLVEKLRGLTRKVASGQH